MFLMIGVTMWLVFAGLSGMIGETVDMKNFGTNTVFAEKPIVVVTIRTQASTHTHKTLITPRRTTMHFSQNVSRLETRCLS